MLLVLSGMCITTLLIGLVPDYQQIGITAPIMITVLRIFQGLFAGGEYGGAVAFMMKTVALQKHGLAGAWQSMTVALGLLAEAANVASLSVLLPLQDP